MYLLFVSLFPYNYGTKVKKSFLLCKHFPEKLKTADAENSFYSQFVVMFLIFSVICTEVGHLIVCQTIEYNHLPDNEQLLFYLSKCTMD